jgi:hypothetical protein
MLSLMSRVKIFLILFLVSLLSLFADARSEISCLAGTIEAEASGESNNGQMAVGCVVLNRYRDRKWAGKNAANTYCNITRKGQFARVANPDRFFIAIANKVTEAQCQNLGYSSLIGFFNPDKKPSEKRVCINGWRTIGLHRFYTKNDYCKPPKKEEPKKKELRKNKDKAKNIRKQRQGSSIPALPDWR